MKQKPFLAPKPRASKPVSQITSDERHFMVELDPGLLKKHPGFRSKGQWQGRFNIATWVRFPEGLNQKVSLVLIYRDADRRKSYKVDACRSNRQTLILLNSNVELQIDGEVTDFALVLEGLAEDSVWILDEYRLEPANTTAAVDSQTTQVSA